MIACLVLYDYKMAGQELSEYEKQRQANIAERDALLKKLALDSASAGIAPKPAKSSAAPGRPPKKKAPVKKIKEEVVPRRTSSRIAGLEADSEKAKRKAEEEYQAVQEQARIKRQRVSGDLSLGDIVVGDNSWDKSRNAFVDVVNRGAQPYERTFGETEVKETSNKELKALREKMSGLELYEGFEPNRECPASSRRNAAKNNRNQDYPGKDILDVLSSRAEQSAGICWRQAGQYGYLRCFAEDGTCGCGQKGGEWRCGGRGRLAGP